MPHVPRRVVSDDDRQAIKVAHKGGASMRALAERFCLPLTTIFEIVHESDDVNEQQNADEIREIDREIAKLRADETRAKRKKRNAEALAIGREIRAWFVLRTKALAVAGARTQAGEPISASEALGLARSVIEANLSDPDIVSWLHALLERTQHAPEERASSNGPDSHE